MKVVSRPPSGPSTTPGQGALVSSASPPARPGPRPCPPGRAARFREPFPAIKLQIETATRAEGLLRPVRPGRRPLAGLARAGHAGPIARRTPAGRPRALPLPLGVLFALRSGEDLPPFRALEQAVRDSASMPGTGSSPLIESIGVSIDQVDLLPTRSHRVRQGAAWVPGTM